MRMANLCKRRDLIKGLGCMTALTAMGATAEPPRGGAAEVLPASLRARVKGRPVTLAILGAGNRGSVYARYAELYPECAKVVAVADINGFRRERMARKHAIPPTRCFADWSECIGAGRLADALVIALPDRLHYHPALQGLDLGYDLLLEKPIAQSIDECRDILARQKATGAIVAVCHVLRYAPIFVEMKRALDAGEIGELIAMQHREPIAYTHMVHAYVRGPAGNSRDTTPIILAKSCHDLDIIRWIVGRPCKRLSAEGSLTLFRPERAPSGAPRRCTDGCPHEKDCPFSALAIYVKARKHLYVFDKPDNQPWTDEFITNILKTSPYGRCAYRCDNDQPDHYAMAMEFEGGVTASFTMDGYNMHAGRRTRLVGTRGTIESDGVKFVLSRFGEGVKRVWDSEKVDLAGTADHGHGGGDLRLVRDFVEAVAQRDISRLTSTLDVSVDSHVMGFLAEKSRIDGAKMSL